VSNVIVSDENCNLTFEFITSSSVQEKKIQKDNMVIKKYFI